MKCKWQDLYDAVRAMQVGDPPLRWLGANVSKRIDSAIRMHEKRHPPEERRKYRIWWYDGTVYIVRVK